jgi:hypothetical protein
VNLCRACEEDFASVAAFDEHRVGDHEFTFREGLERIPPSYEGRRCLSPDEIEAAGWKRDRWGRWRLPAGLEPKLFERVRL